jgi:16S rRNA (cytosine967-C5)-methyltransferase
VTRVDPARRAAFDALRAVEERGAYLNLTLPGLLRERGLSGRDAAFATELVYGSVRLRGSYDPVLAACLSRPLAELDAGVREVLRLGTHQLLGMRIAPHAAVSTSVDLVRDAAGHRPVSLVNAVLRRVAERSLADWFDAVIPADAEPLDRLAITHSHPRWIVQALHEAAGGDLAATAALLAADNTAPQVTLAARPGRCDVTELLAAGAVAGRWSPYAAVLPAGDPGSLAAVREGRAGVQDEGSQLVALAVAAAQVAGPDRRWLDLCAGPGGKAALLAGLAGRVGARLLAADRAPHRAGLAAAALARAGGVLGVVAADATRPPWPSGGFDRVLADVPCTGLGALRRRPEARWRRRPDDLATLQTLQRRLLHAAVDAVRPGGVAVYATCSPHPAETSEVVDAVLAERTDVQLADARPLVPEVSSVGAGPYVQLWPHVHATDAMFFALLRRCA